MSEKVKCDVCTDKEHCPEYIPGAPCVEDRKEENRNDENTKLD